MFKNLIELTKVRIGFLVLTTTIIGFYLGAQGKIDNMLLLFTVIGTLLSSTGSSVMNNVIESESDKLMDRTKNRPIPTGKILPSDALVFGVLGSVMSVIIIGLSINWLAGFYLGFTIIFYSILYTIFLKRYTVQNIVIGGASGALPPVIGWTIATNSLSLEPITFFLIIFYWTPSHFWALSLYKAKDYAKAKIPMLPITNGVEETKKKIICCREQS